MLIQPLGPKGQTSRRVSALCWYLRLLHRHLSSNWSDAHGTGTVAQSPVHPSQHLTCPAHSQYSTKFSKVILKHWTSTFQASTETENSFGGRDKEGKGTDMTSQWAFPTPDLSWGPRSRNSNTAHNENQG